MRRLPRIALVVAGFLRTQRGKQVGGQVLHQAARVADRATKQRHTDRIERARAAAERGLQRL